MDSVNTRSAASPMLIIIAFAIIYLVWGSTYITILFAIETIPPFLMGGIRFLSAGLILYAFIRPRQQAAPTARNWLAAAVVGCLMLVGGNGLVCWAEQSVPTGVAALIIGTVPLWMVFFEWTIFRGPRPSLAVLIGLLAGLCGVFILIGPGSVGGEAIDPAGGIALLTACAFWSFGSLCSRHAKMPQSTFLSVAMQMIAGGAAFFLIGTIGGEWARFEVAAVTLKSWLSVLYLSLIGSIVALSAYVWLLQVSTAAKVSTYAYVNPVIAVILGALFASEPITPRAMLAAAAIISSVALITRGSRKSAVEPVQTVPPSREPIVAVPALERNSIPENNAITLRNETLAGCSR